MSAISRFRSAEQGVSPNPETPSAPATKAAAQTTSNGSLAEETGALGGLPVLPRESRSATARPGGDAAGSRSIRQGASLHFDMRRTAVSEGPQVGGMQKLSMSVAKAVGHHGKLLRPDVSKSRTRNGRVKITLGERTFFAGTIMVERDGKTEPMKVLAERGFHGSDELKERQAFYPLNKDLLPDTSVRLIKKPHGEWGVLGGAKIDASQDWLPADALDTLERMSYKSGFHQVGRREFCVAPVMEGPKLSDTSKPVMIERIRGATPDADRYSVLNPDLSEAGTVALVDDPARADPFVSEIVSHFKGWGAQDSQGRALAEAAAVSAFHGGASVEDAIALSEDLVLGAKVSLDAGGAAEIYAAAGAGAGLVRRAGAGQETAARTARAVTRMAEAMQVHAGTGPDSRKLASLKAAYADAASGFDGMRASVVERSRAAGPDITAIHAAARQLFIEKTIPAKDLPGVAKEAARRRVAVLANADRQSGDKLSAADIELGTAKATVAELEAELADQRKRPAPADAGGSRWGSALFSSWRKRPAGETPVDTPPDKHTVAIESRLDAAKTTLRAVEARRNAVMDAGHTVHEEAGLVADDRKAHYDAAVKALLTASKAAPGKQNAAVIAARAACAASAEHGDPQTAERAAVTAHLAMLGGASERDALAAASLLARSLSRPGDPQDSADIPSMQVAYAQAACAGGELAAQDGQDGPSRQRTLAAAAAAECLRDPKVDLSTVAALMGDPVSQARPFSSLDRTRSAPLFYSAEANASPRKAGQRRPGAVPEGYEAVESALNPVTAASIEKLEHAKIRKVENLGVNSDSGLSATHYMVQIRGDTGLYWSDLAWSGNMNQLYGEIPIRPRDASDDQLAAQATAVVAYNGVTAEWESFEQRSKDLTAKVSATLKEIEKTVISRDDNWGFSRLPYHGRSSGYMQNIVGSYNTLAEEEIRLFVQGRQSQPAFKMKMASLFAELASKLEGDRSRKKAIIRHQIDATIRAAAVVAGTGVGVARVVAAFG